MFPPVNSPLKVTYLGKFRCGKPFWNVETPTGLLQMESGDSLCGHELFQYLTEGTATECETCTGVETDLEVDAWRHALFTPVGTDDDLMLDMLKKLASETLADNGYLDEDTVRTEGHWNAASILDIMIASQLENIPKPAFMDWVSSLYDFNLENGPGGGA